MPWSPTNQTKPIKIFPVKENETIWNFDKKRIKYCNLIDYSIVQTHTKQDVFIRRKIYRLVYRLYSNSAYVSSICMLR